MTAGKDPLFLSLETVNWLHRESLRQHGGLGGVRDGDAIEAALGAAKNAYYYGAVTSSILLPRTPTTWQNRRRFTMEINAPALPAPSLSSGNLHRTKWSFTMR